MLNEWVFDTASQTWMYGTEKEGCGVYNEDGFWEGNVCCASQVIFGVGKGDNKEQVMAECLKKLNELKAEYDYFN